MSQSEQEKQQAELNHLEANITDEQAEQEQIQADQQLKQEQQEAVNVDVWTPLIKVGIDFKAPNWNTTVEEATPMGSALGAVVDKYFPDTDILENYKEELSLGFAVYAFWAAKSGIPMTIQPEEKEEKNEEA